MIKQELFNYLVSAPNPDKNGQQKREKNFKKNHPDLYQEFLNFEFSEDLSNASFVQKLFHFLQDDHGNLGICVECGKRCMFKYFGIDGYSKFCSNKCANRNEECNQKRKETCIKHFGGFGLESDIIMERFKQTMKKRHGAEYSGWCEKIRDKINKSNFENNDGIGFASKKVRETFLKNIKEKRGDGWQSRSQIEDEIYEYIRFLYNEKDKILRNDRQILDGKELDIYIPEINLAFEVNGDFWHMNPELYKEGVNYSGRTVEEERIKREYKTTATKNKGIELIHIWQYDWVNRKRKIKKLIRNKILEHYERLL